MMVSAAAALLLGTCSLPAPTRPPWLGGERIAYAVELNGARTGEATLSVDPAGAGAWQVGVEARQSSLLGSARFSARSALSPALRPGRFRDQLDGWGGRRTSDAQIDRSPNAVRIEWTAGGKPGMNAYLRRPTVLDFASTVPYLRAAALSPGASFCFDAVGATQYWRVEGQMAPSQEAVATPMGRFHAFRLDATMARADGKGGRVPLRLWIATDPSRLPVAAEAETPLGRIRVEITRFTPGST